MKLANLLVGIVIIILNSLILRYVHELESKQCKCANVWQHEMIKYVSPIVIIFSLIFICMDTEYIIKLCSQNKLLAVILSSYVSLLLVYKIVLILYFLKLTYSKCECSRDWKRWGLLYPSLYFAIILLWVVVVQIIVICGMFPKLMNELLKNLKIKN